MARRNLTRLKPAPTKSMQNSTARVFPENDDSKVTVLYPDAAASENKSVITVPASKYYALAQLLYVPNSIAVNFLMEFLEAGSSLSKSQRSPGVKYTEFTSTGLQPAIRRESDKERSPALTITVDDKSFSPKPGNDNVWFQKLLLYVLIISNHQNNPDTVRFPLQSLVDIGLYGSVNNARRGVNAFFEYQKHFCLEQADKKRAYHGGVLFLPYTIKSNYVELSRNTEVDFLTEYITVIPSFVFMLRPAAFVLTHYIFATARQRATKIFSNGCFTLSLRGICERMALPTPEEVEYGKCKEKIQTPVESAVEEINAAAKGFADGVLELTIVTPDGNIKQWLDGHLEIRLDGAYAEVFRKIAKSKTGKITRFAAAKEVEAGKIAARAESQKILTRCS